MYNPDHVSHSELLPVATVSQSELQAITRSDCKLVAGTISTRSFLKPMYNNFIIQMLYCNVYWHSIQYLSISVTAFFCQFLNKRVQMLSYY